MSDNMSTHFKRGFTIWELICVIIVILLLVGLLMPSLSRVRKMSKKVVCMSILKQYGIAGAFYLDSNNDEFPEYNEWLYSELSIGEEHPIGCRWHDMAMAPDMRIMRDNPQFKGLMWNYINQNSLGICPQFRSVADSRGCENPRHLNSIIVRPQYNYTMNGYLGSTRAGGVVKASQVRDPSKVFFFGEENSWSLRPDHPRYPARWLDKPLSTKALDDTTLLISSSSQARDCFATFHDSPGEDFNRGQSNMTFIDGHVDSISVEQQLKQKERGWSSELPGNLSFAWAAKELPFEDIQEKESND